jgi:hypothetical protein
LATWQIKHPEIEMAILFGSYAKASKSVHRDMGLAIQLSSGQTIQA